VRFAIRFVAEYGIDSLIADPSELIEWKRRRAQDFLSGLEFNSIQVDVIAILAAYRYVASDMLLALVSAPDTEEVARSLRTLEEFCCIERRERYYYISSPLRDAVRRDDRFSKPGDWLQALGANICEIIKDYEDSDSISVPIIETATMAAARGAAAPAFLSNLILPSHLLRIARDFYDRRRWGTCIEFCERAFAMKDRLPVDAQVEVLRLWGLSAVRLNDMNGYHDIITKLGGYNGQVSERIKLFVEGFNFRVRGDLDRAEEKFLQAWKISRRNQSINRELASLYCKQRRYSDAEVHARAAYETAPTNPFIVDILAETLLGKIQAGLQVDRLELAGIFRDLEIYGDAPGSSFFLIREGQKKAKDRDYPGAMRCLNRAVERTPALLAPYFLRAEVLLRMNDIVGAERDWHEINRLLTEAGGFSEGDEIRAQELEVMILLEKKQFRAAKEKLERAAFMPRSMAQRLSGQIARAIAFDPDAADSETREWAKRINGRTEGRGGTRRRGRFGQT
jgi:tetratricopeptide (TPR) repeat protein